MHAAAKSQLNFDFPSNEKTSLEGVENGRFDVAADS
jgi:hypothetical protein